MTHKYIAIEQEYAGKTCWLKTPDGTLESRIIGGCGLDYAIIKAWYRCGNIGRRYEIRVAWPIVQLKMQAHKTFDASFPSNKEVMYY